MYAYRKPKSSSEKPPPTAAVAAASFGAGNAAAQEQMTAAPEERSSLLDAPDVDDGISGGTQHNDGEAQGLSGSDAADRVGDSSEEAAPTNARLADAQSRRAGEGSGGAPAVVDKKQAVKDAIGGWSRIPGGKAGTQGGASSVLPATGDAAVDSIAGMGSSPDADDHKNGSDKESQQSSENSAVTGAKEDIKFVDHVGAGYDRGGVGGAVMAAWSYVNLHTRDHEQTEKNNRMTGATAGTRGRPAPDSDTGSVRMPKGYQPGKVKGGPGATASMRKKMVGGPDAASGTGGLHLSLDDLKAKSDKSQQPYINPGDGSTTVGTSNGSSTPSGKRVTPTGQPAGTTTGFGPNIGPQPTGPAPDDPTATTASGKDPKKP